MVNWPRFFSTLPTVCPSKVQVKSTVLQLLCHLRIQMNVACVLERKKVPSESAVAPIGTLVARYTYCRVEIQEASPLLHLCERPVRTGLSCRV